MNRLVEEKELIGAEVELVAAEAAFAAVTQRIDRLWQELAGEYNNTPEAVAMQLRLRSALDAGNVEEVVGICHRLCREQREYIARRLSACDREYDQVCTRVSKARWRYESALLRWTGDRRSGERANN